MPSTKLCPICAETMVTNKRSKLPNRALRLTCCNQYICQDCLYRHTLSILDEGVSGQGRSKLVCPVGCGHELSDGVVRATLIRAHPLHWIPKLSSKVAFFVLVQMGWYQQENTMNNFMRRSIYDAWLYWNHSSETRRDLVKYERWNLAVGLRSTREEVMHCPAPDCGYMWIASELYRKHKRAHENKPYYLWYAPPRPEQCGDYTWVHAEYLNPGAGNFVEQETRDGRRMVCAKCLTVFCGLCRRPWGQQRRQNSHRNVPCQVYAQRFPVRDDGYAFVAQMTDARCCPGCSLRTSRTAGCNHMTCPCGYEWCYVCETRWHPRHYACVDQPRNNNNHSDDAICIIS